MNFEFVSITCFFKDQPKPCRPHQKQPINRNGNDFAASFKMADPDWQKLKRREQVITIKIPCFLGGFFTTFH
jgi:hypothetical protein